jgi:hypothetical protein
MKESQGDFGALSVITSNSRLRLNETSLEDPLQTRMQQERPAGWAWSDCTATPPWAQSPQQWQLRKERKDMGYLAKTFMTCLPVTGFDKRNKRKPRWWVEFSSSTTNKNKRAKVD